MTLVCTLRFLYRVGRTTDVSVERQAITGVTKGKISGEIAQNGGFAGWSVHDWDFFLP